MKFLLSRIAVTGGHAMTIGSASGPGVFIAEPKSGCFVSIPGRNAGALPLAARQAKRMFGHHIVHGLEGSSDSNYVKESRKKPTGADFTPFE